ncbi:MAG: glycerophosphodiester phosphodiesterase [Nocardioides sp.]
MSVHTAPVSVATEAPSRSPQRPWRYLDKGTPEGVLAFAHRGGALHPDNRHLENTLAGFRHAYGLGYRHLETDVHLSADGVLVAFHDDSLDRVTDGTGLIATLPYAEIACARIAGKHHVPTMAELFEALPDAAFNIDLKADGCGAALWQLIEQYDAHDRVLVGSFSTRRLREFRRISGGRVPTSAGPAEVAAYRLSPSGRLAKLLLRGGPDALQVPRRSTRIPLATARMVRKAHAAGIQLHVWTVDDPSDIQQLIDRGVDGVMTDRTDTLRTVLSQRGLWREHQ